MAWQKLRGFRGDATFRTWLLTIVWRKALDNAGSGRPRVWWLRTERARPAGDEIDPLDVARRATSADPERIAVSRRSGPARADGHRAAVTPKLRDTLLLAASGEHTYEEIAAILGRAAGHREMARRRSQAPRQRPGSGRTG